MKVLEVNPSCVAWLHLQVQGFEKQGFGLAPYKERTLAELRSRYMYTCTYPGLLGSRVLVWAYF